MVIPVGPQWDYQVGGAVGCSCCCCSCCFGLALLRHGSHAHLRCPGGGLPTRLVCLFTCCACLPCLQVMQCIDKDSEGRVKKHDLM